MLRTYQLSVVGEMVGVDGETDLSEDQEAELSADLEVVIGRGDRGRGRGGRRPRRVVYGQLYLPDPI